VRLDFVHQELIGSLDC